MLFFNTFPTTYNNGKLLTDITLRLNYLNLSWVSNPILYYDYVLKEGDTPDNLADRYYDDPNLHWVILTTNYILNPLFEFPMKGFIFENYLNTKYKKYGGINYTYETPDPIVGYQKLITIKNESTNAIISQDYYVIDKQTYESMNGSNGLYTKYFQDGDDTISYDVDKRIVTIFQNEHEINEQKRNIKILKKEYKQESIFKLNSALKLLK